MIPTDHPVHDWNSAAVEVLLNPRLPDPQRAALLDAQRAMPALPGHVWITTSGSSGVKWVALSKEAILASAQAVNAHLAASDADSWALALPTFHVGGLGILARAFLSGARVHQFTGKESRWDAGEFHSFLTETRAALTALVPTQLHDLVRGAYAAPPGLRAVVVGGGALSPDLYRAARALGWPALPSYGLSECCSQAATAALGSVAEDLGGQLPPLAVLTHVTAHISGEGRILLRSPSLLTGYGLLGDPPRFVDPKEDGWFLTEDRGSLAGTDLTVEGRIGDFVKIGGESADVARLVRLWDDLWARIQQSETGLPETVLVAAPDARLGAAIHLVAAGDPALEPAVTRAVEEFNRRVLPFERIRGLHPVAAIPRSPLGKLLRTELLERAGLRGG